MADKQKMASENTWFFLCFQNVCVYVCVCAAVIENNPYQSSVYLLSPSHGLGKLLLVGAGVFVPRDVPGRVHHVHAPGLPLPAPAVVEALLVRAGELAGVREAADRGGRHRSLQGSQEHLHLWSHPHSCSHHALTVLPTCRRPYRDPGDDRRPPFYQLEDLSLRLLCRLLFVFLLGQFSQCRLELVKRDVTAGFLPKMCKTSMSAWRLMTRPPYACRWSQAIASFMTNTKPCVMASLWQVYGLRNEQIVSTL